MSAPPPGDPFFATRSWLFVSAGIDRTLDALDVVLAEGGWARQESPDPDVLARRFSLLAGGDDERALLAWNGGESFADPLGAAAPRLSERLRARCAIASDDGAHQYEEWTGGACSLRWDDQGTFARSIRDGRIPRPSDQPWLEQFDAEQNAVPGAPVPSLLGYLGSIVQARIGIGFRPDDLAARRYEHRRWIPWEGTAAVEAAAYFDGLHRHARTTGFAEVPRFGRLLHATTAGGTRTFRFTPSAALVEAVRTPGYPLAIDEPFANDAVLALLRGDDDIPLGANLLLYRTPAPSPHAAMLIRDF